MPIWQQHVEQTLALPKTLKFMWRGVHVLCSVNVLEALEHELNVVAMVVNSTVHLKLQDLQTYQTDD